MGLLSELFFLMWSNREPHGDIYILVGMNRPLTTCVSFWEHYRRAEEFLCFFGGVEGQGIVAQNSF